MIDSKMYIDVVSTWIKYTEKFFVIPGTDKIITKPFDAWTKEHQDVAQVPSSNKRIASSII